MAKKNKQSVFETTIQQFLEAVGGDTNLKKVFNCASRLRFYVIDESKVDLEKLKKVYLSKGFQKSGEEYQLIFGTGTVQKVFDYYDKHLLAKHVSHQGSLVLEAKVGFFTSSKEQIKKIGFKAYLFNTLRKGIRGFASIFIPLIPLFVCGGFCLAIQAVIKSTAEDAISAKQGAAYIAQ
jgi:PTS system sucrose-specific IIC component